MPISSKFVSILKISLVNELVVHNLIKIIGKKIWYLLQWKFSIFVILSCYYDSNRSAKTTSQNSKAHYQNKNLGKSSIKHVNINRGKSLHKGLYCERWMLNFRISLREGSYGGQFLRFCLLFPSSIVSLTLHWCLLN